MSRDSAFPPVEKIALALEETADGLQEARGALEVLDDVLERIPYPMIVGNGTHWVACSKAFSDLLGWTRKTLENETWETLVHPDDHAATIAATLQVLSTGKIGTILNRYRCTDGTYRNLFWRWGPPGPSGYTVAVAEDRGPI